MSSTAFSNLSLGHDLSTIMQITGTLTMGKGVLAAPSQFTSLLSDYGSIFPKSENHYRRFFQNFEKLNKIKILSNHSLIPPMCGACDAIFIA